MVGWHHQLNGHEFVQTPRDSEGQGSLACYSPWGRIPGATVDGNSPANAEYTGLSPGLGRSHVPRSN